MRRFVLVAVLLVTLGVAAGSSRAADAPTPEALRAWVARIEGQLTKAEQRVAALDGAKAEPKVAVLRIRALDARIAALERAAGLPVRAASGSVELDKQTADVAAFGTRLDAIVAAEKSRPATPTPVAAAEPPPPASADETPSSRPEPAPDETTTPRPPAPDRTARPATPRAPRPADEPRRADPAPPTSDPEPDTRSAERRILGLSLFAFAALGWIVSGLVGGLCGASRKRFAAGFLLGVVLGPFGWLIALFLPSPAVSVVNVHIRRGRRY